MYLEPKIVLEKQIITMTLHVILKSRALEFVKSFILCTMFEVNLILGDTFFETHIVDVR